MEYIDTKKQRGRGRPKGHKIKINHDELLKKYNSKGYTISQIAEYYNCTYRTITYRLKLIKEDIGSYYNTDIKDVLSIKKEQDMDDLGNIRGDSDGYEFINDILHGELREFYWKFYKKNKQLVITYNHLLKLSGPERAKILRSDPKLREIYTEKTQRI